MALPRTADRHVERSLNVLTLQGIHALFNDDVDYQITW